jgi:hypothetical protein
MKMRMLLVLLVVGFSVAAADRWDAERQRLDRDKKTVV